MKITRYTKVKLTANPNEDYKFKKWNNGITANPYITTVGNIISYRNKLAAVFELTNTPPSEGEDIEPVDTNCPVDEIWYTTTDEQPISFVQSGWGANVISNTYENGKGIIKFDNDVLYSPSGAFKRKSTIKTIIFPNNISYIEELLCSECTNLFYVILPTNLIEIHRGSFYGCSSLKKIIIPNKVTKIKYDAFRKCEMLTDIILGEKVSNIEYNAFVENSNLSSITVLNSNVPTINISRTMEGGGDYYYINALNGKSGSVNRMCPIYVPAESLNDYKNSNWNKYWVSKTSEPSGTSRNILPIENNEQ